MIRTVVLYFVLYTSASCLGHVNYDNYQVHRISPKNNDQLVALRTLQDSNPDYNFWSDVSSLGFPVDVMVPPQLQNDFKNFVSSHNLNAKLWIEDVQARIAPSNPNKSTEFDWSDYKTLDEIYAWLDELVEKYPVVNPVLGGRSHEGREIRGVKVSFGPKKKGVFIESGIHASEWIAPATVTYILHQILTNQDPKVREAVESRDWYVFPSVNPDGYVYSHETDRLWRKNRKPYPGCNGVDLNRNWAYHWMDGGGSNDSCHKFFAGASPASEIETQSLSEYIDTVAHDLDIYLAFHSYFQLFLIPYGHQGLEKPDNNDELHRIGNIAARSLVERHGTRYLVGNTADTLYLASGMSIDWVRANYKVPIVYLVELRDTGEHGFLLPADQIIPTGEETFDAVVKIVQQANGS